MRTVRFLVISVSILLTAAVLVPSVNAQIISIRGTVTVEDGSDLAGAVFKVIPMQGNKAARQAKVKKNGKFTLPGVEFGNYKFKVEKEGLMIKSIHVVVKTQANAVQIDESVDIGPMQELPTFDIKPGWKTTVDIVMVPGSYFGQSLAIPGNKEATDWLVEANNLAGQGKYKESDALLMKIVETGDATANVYYILGRNAHMTGRKGDAEKWFLKTLELNPEQKGVYGQLASMAHDAGESEKALELMEKELELSPEAVNVAINYAVILVDMERYEEAVEAFHHVLELSPSEAPAYAELAGLYTELGQEDKAVEMLNKMEEVSEPDPALWYNIGANFSNRDLYDQAEMAYRKALEVDPTFPLAIRELGYLMIRKGDKAGALELFNEYLDLAPDAGDADQVTGLRDVLQQQVGGE